MRTLRFTIKFLLLGLLCCLLAGRTVVAQEEISAADWGVVFQMQLHHRHIGSSAGGGCYRLPNYHQHIGSPAEDGGCYTQPVYHLHKDTCYRDRLCTVKAVRVTDPVRLALPAWCECHGDNTYNEAEVTWQHSDCSLGTRTAVMRYLTYHGWEHQLDQQTHVWQQLVCDRAGEADEYELSCGMTEETIEDYAVNCGQTEASVVGTLMAQIDTAGWAQEKIARFYWKNDDGQNAVETLTPVNCLLRQGAEEEYLLEGEEVSFSEKGTWFCCLADAAGTDSREHPLQISVDGIDCVAPEVNLLTSAEGTWTNQPIHIRVSACDR